MASTPAAKPATAPSPVTPSHSAWSSIVVTVRSVRVGRRGRCQATHRRTSSGLTTCPSSGSPNASSTSRLSQASPLPLCRSNQVSITTAHWSAKGKVCQSSKARVGISTSWLPVLPAPSSPDSVASSNRVVVVAELTSSRAANPRSSRVDSWPSRRSSGGRWSQCSSSTSIRRTSSNADPAAAFSTRWAGRTANGSSGGIVAGGGPAVTSSSIADIARTARSAVKPTGSPQSSPRSTSRTIASRTDPRSASSIGRSATANGAGMPEARVATQFSKAFRPLSASVTECRVVARDATSLRLVGCGNARSGRSSRSRVSTASSRSRSI